MGKVRKKTVKQYKHRLSVEERLEKDIKDCMHCKFFWGNNHRCATSKCGRTKVKKVPEKKIPEKCVGCPYRQSERYCFPCMKDILSKSKS